MKMTLSCRERSLNEGLKQVAHFRRTRNCERAASLPRPAIRPKPRSTHHAQNSDVLQFPTGPCRNGDPHCRRRGDCRKTRVRRLARLCTRRATDTRGSDDLTRPINQATPMLVAVAEKAAYLAAQAHLKEPWTTVGTRIDVEHVAASPTGLKITAEARLVKHDKRTLHFEILVRDDREIVGRGTHIRAIVDASKFLPKAELKRSAL